MTMLIATLMLPMKKFEWSVIVESLVTIATSYVGFLIIHVLIENNDFNAEAQAEGVICAITGVIAIGVFLGTLKMWQYIMVGILFAACYRLNQWLVFTGDIIPGVIDPGAAITVHMFAAYWGIGCALGIQERRILNNDIKFSVHATVFIYLSSILLWILWPSFVTIYYMGELGDKGMASCYMAGTGSMITAFIADYLIEKKINSLVYAYALLGGDVAISSTMFFVGPWGGLLVGAIAGVISVLSFNYVHPFITKHFKILDVMGVHNLHGVCSWTSVLCCFIGAYCKNGKGHWTLIAGLICTALALVLGLICGFIFRFTMGKKIPKNDLFNDHADFWFSEGEKEAALENVEEESELEDNSGKEKKPEPKNEEEKLKKEEEKPKKEEEKPKKEEKKPKKKEEEVKEREKGQRGKGGGQRAGVVNPVVTVPYQTVVKVNMENVINFSKILL